MAVLVLGEQSCLSECDVGPTRAMGLLLLGACVPFKPDLDIRLEDFIGPFAGMVVGCNTWVSSMGSIGLVQ